MTMRPLPLRHRPQGGGQVGCGPPWSRGQWRESVLGSASVSAAMYLLAGSLTTGWEVIPGPRTAVKPCISTLSICSQTVDPFDTVKARLQVQPHNAPGLGGMPMYRSTAHAVFKVSGETIKGASAHH